MNGSIVIAAKLTQKIANSHPEMTRGRNNFYDNYHHRVVSRTEVEGKVSLIIESLNTQFGLIMDGETVADIIGVNATHLLKDNSEPSKLAKRWYDDYKRSRNASVYSVVSIRRV